MWIRWEDPSGGGGDGRVERSDTPEYIGFFRHDADGPTYRSQDAYRPYSCDHLHDDVRRSRHHQKHGNTSNRDSTRRRHPHYRRLLELGLLVCEDQKDIWPPSCTPGKSRESSIKNGTLTYPLRYVILATYPILWSILSSILILISRSQKRQRRPKSRINTYPRRRRTDTPFAGCASPTYMWPLAWWRQT